jgi:hypothetical protein
VLNGIILATDASFVLYDDPAVLDLAVRSCTGGSASTAAATPANGEVVARA